MFGNMVEVTDPSIFVLSIARKKNVAINVCV